MRKFMYRGEGEGKDFKGVRENKRGIWGRCRQNGEREGDRGKEEGGRGKWEEVSRE